LNIGPEEETPELVFQLSRVDLYNIVRITARTRLLPKLTVPLVAGVILLGHSLDGNYLKGLVWAAGAALVYWGFSQILIFLHVYAPSNETLLVPQRIRLFQDRMAVSSEHSEEEFFRPDPSGVKAVDRYLLIPMGKNSLVFMRRSFSDPEDFERLKKWVLGGESRGRKEREG